MVPGEKFSTTTSAHSISGFKISRLSGFFMSSARLRFEVFRCANHGLSSKLPGFETLTCTSSRVRQGRVRLSTLITSAPRSPSIFVVIEPTRAQEKSSTRTPANGPVAPSAESVCPGCARGRERALAAPEAPPPQVRPARIAPECAAGYAAVGSISQKLRAVRCGSASTSPGSAITVALMPRRRPSVAISALLRVAKKAAIACSHDARVLRSSVERL